MLLDHHFIDVELKSVSETVEHNMVTYHKIKNISPQDFSNNMGNTLGKLDLEAMDLYQAVETFNNSKIGPKQACPSEITYSESNA